MLRKRRRIRRGLRDYAEARGSFSENENLNYALPIAELLDAPQTGELESETRYWLPFLSEPTSGQHEQTIAMPVTYAQFADEAMSFSAKQTDELTASLLAKNADGLFPRGEGAAQLLQVNFRLPGLAVIRRREDGTWDAFQGENPTTVQLTDNGHVFTTKFGRLLLLTLARTGKYKEKDMQSQLKEWMAGMQVFE